MNETRKAWWSCKMAERTRLQGFTALQPGMSSKLLSGVDIKSAPCFWSELCSKSKHGAGLQYKGLDILQARVRDKDLREREAQLHAGSAASSRTTARDSALEQREAALADREAAMARASAAAEYARSEAETLWRNHKACSKCGSLPIPLAAP